MTVVSDLEPFVYLLLGAGAVLAFRRVVDALERCRWLVGDDPHPAVGQTRSHVRLVRDDESRPTQADMKRAAATALANRRSRLHITAGQRKALENAWRQR